MVQESVARFVDEQAIPLMREAFEQHHFPRELIPQVAELGFARQLPRTATTALA